MFRQLIAASLLVTLGANAEDCDGPAAPEPAQTPPAKTLPTAPKPEPAPTPGPGRDCTVVKAVDGDTFKLTCAGQRVTVRVIGIDTPETKDPRKPVQCYGPQAAAEAARVLPAGERTRLIADPSQDVLDKYGRGLGYLTLAKGNDYGQYMITRGFAREYTYRKPYQKQASYKRAEHRAQAAGRGLWGACPR